MKIYELNTYRQMHQMKTKRSFEMFVCVCLFPCFEVIVKSNCACDWRAIYVSDAHLYSFLSESNQRKNARNLLDCVYTAQCKCMMLIGLTRNVNSSMAYIRRTLHQSTADARDKQSHTHTKKFPNRTKANKGKE